jgi:RNA polymerase sigma-70 factor (TIGR02960 family)
MARMDEGAFAELVEAHRRELHAHCYRMLGSVQDAEDAVQNALLGAWQGFGSFEGRSSVRTWLYRIATNACLRMVERARPRIPATEYAPARSTTDDLGAPVMEPIWLEPYPHELPAGADPGARYEQRESVELAFVAALQRLPATQRAVLILRDVLAFSAAEVADQLDTTVAAANSALQRARAAMAGNEPDQQQTLRALGEPKQRALVTAMVDAWQAADVDALLELLTEDVRLTMPPLPAWFDGKAEVARFVRERMFATPWRLRPITANGQLAFACYQRQPDGVHRLGAVLVVRLRADRIAALDSFLDPALRVPFDLPEVFS